MIFQPRSSELSDNTDSGSSDIRAILSDNFSWSSPAQSCPSNLNPVERSSNSLAQLTPTRILTHFMADKSNRRLQAVLNALQPPPSSLWKRIIVLPDDSKVDISPAHPSEVPTVIAIDGTAICAFKVLPRSIKLVISSIGTPHENSADHVPEFPVLELLPPSTIDPNRGHSESRISIGDVWAAIYALNIIYHTQETIPIQLALSLANVEEITSYIIGSGLGRRRHVQQGVPSESEIYLSRDAFWQGAGTLGFHARGWLRTRLALQGAAPFPRIPSFTRSPLVITSHPLRPPKPKPGECVYRRFCPSVGQTLDFTYVDPSDRPNGEISPHLAAFHKWHNDERVNKGWGEAGPIEKHRKYLCDLMQDPGVLPLMMSWDGELMGYTEVTWVKVGGYSALC